MTISSVGEMRELDRRAIEEYGIPEQILMENAGLAAFQVIRSELGVEGGRFVVLCGIGNNGGDGLVVARKLHSEGAEVVALVAGDRGGFRGSSEVNLELAQRAGVEIVDQVDVERVVEELEGCDVAVDALLGTGLTRDVGGRLAEIIEAVNLYAETVVSLDIPSGVDGNTGQVRGIAVAADCTVTFGLPKRGNLLYPGAALGGQLFVSHISFPPQLQAAPDIRVSLSEPPPLPPRAVGGHKGTFGDALFIAGAAAYFGAPSLSARSFLRAGGGYSRLAAPRSLVPSLAPLAPEVVYAPQAETASGSLAVSAAERLLELAAQVDLVVLGPGLSLATETQELVRRLVAAIEAPLLVDGDGLTALASDLEVLRRRASPTVLTPHPGEAARLLGASTAEVTGDPITAAQRLAASSRAVVALKGAHSLIAEPDGRVRVNTSGNSGLATAGSGDVLTGTIAAAFGLGLPVVEAVAAGVFIHGLAGDLAAADLGEDGVTAVDVLDCLPEAVETYREHYDELLEDFYGAIEVV